MTKSKVMESNFPQSGRSNRGVVGSVESAAISAHVAMATHQRDVAQRCVAILSTTVLPVDGTYEVLTWVGPTPLGRDFPREPGMTQYIGHPTTKRIVEDRFYTRPPETPLFQGLEVGQAALCVSIAQGRSDRAQGGTAANQDVSENDLVYRLVLRIS